MNSRLRGEMTPRRKPAPLLAESIGEPVRVVPLAALLLQLHQQRALRLVAADAGPIEDRRCANVRVEGPP